MPAAFGNPPQGDDDTAMLIDTTTPFVAITSKDCDNCKERHGGDGVFDTDNSDTFKSIGSKDNPVTITMSQIELIGYWGQDTIQEAKGSPESPDAMKVDGFEFFVITSIGSDDNRKDLDGVIGLASP